jgi:hypothetical protein
VSFIALHDRCDNAIIDNAHEKKFRINLEFTGDILLGIIRRYEKIATLPKLNDALLVFYFKGSNKKISGDNIIYLTINLI